LNDVGLLNRVEPVPGDGESNASFASICADLRRCRESQVDEEIAVILEHFRTGAIATQMPFFNTQADLHALFRWNRDQQFKPNDWLDYMHAASALPYFDFFFTERVLARVVSAQPLAYVLPLRRSSLLRSLRCAEIAADNLTRISGTE
jgi:hypothetical protein